MRTSEFQERSISLLDQYLDLIDGETNPIELINHWSWLQSEQLSLLTDYTEVVRKGAVITDKSLNITVK